MGAQNCWSEPSGAFTGEVSPAMVKETGCTYVILGHSERRNTIGPTDANGKVAGESNAMIAAKVRAVFDAGLTPIVCVGETLAQRDAGETESVLTSQLAGSLATVQPDEAAKLVVAYEPVWAIGTGRTATVEQAQAAHAHIRGQLLEQLGSSAAHAIRDTVRGQREAGQCGGIDALQRCGWGAGRRREFEGGRFRRDYSEVKAGKRPLTRTKGFSTCWRWDSWVGC